MFLLKSITFYKYNNNTLNKLTVCYLNKEKTKENKDIQNFVLFNTDIATTDVDLNIPVNVIEPIILPVTPSYYQYLSIAAELIGKSQSNLFIDNANNDLLEKIKNTNIKYKYIKSPNYYFMPVTWTDINVLIYEPYQNIEHLYDENALSSNIQTSIPYSYKNLVKLNTFKYNTSIINTNEYNYSNKFYIEHNFPVQKIISEFPYMNDLILCKYKKKNKLLYIYQYRIFDTNTVLKNNEIEIILKNNNISIQTKIKITNNYSEIDITPYYETNIDDVIKYIIDIFDRFNIQLTDNDINLRNYAKRLYIKTNDKSFVTRISDLDNNNIINILPIKQNSIIIKIPIYPNTYRLKLYNTSAKTNYHEYITNTVTCKLSYNTIENIIIDINAAVNINEIQNTKNILSYIFNNENTDIVLNETNKNIAKLAGEDPVLFSYEGTEGSTYSRSCQGIQRQLIPDQQGKIKIKNMTTGQISSYTSTDPNMFLSFKKTPENMCVPCFSKTPMWNSMKNYEYYEICSDLYNYVWPKKIDKKVETEESYIKYNGLLKWYNRHIYIDDLSIYYNSNIYVIDKIDNIYNHLYNDINNNIASICILMDNFIFKYIIPMHYTSDTYLDKVTNAKHIKLYIKNKDNEYFETNYEFEKNKAKDIVNNIILNLPYKDIYDPIFKVLSNNKKIEYLNIDSSGYLYGYKLINNNNEYSINPSIEHNNYGIDVVIGNKMDNLITDNKEILKIINKGKEIQLNYKHNNEHEYLTKLIEFIKNDSTFMTKDHEIYTEILDDINIICKKNNIPYIEDNVLQLLKYISYSKENKNSINMYYSDMLVFDIKKNSNYQYNII